VNDRGQVVGWFENEQGVMRAFVWSEPNGVRELPAPASSVTSARFITNAGRILGRTAKT
jgi:probable HAF family extracellular repeat protein